MKSPPNILYLMTDMQKASASSVYGNTLVPDPFMSRMAREGWVFENAFAPSSICTPSRASVFTGTHPLVHRVTCHQNRLPYNLPQLSEILLEAGFYTTVAGHYEEVRGLSRGWHEQVPSNQRTLRRAYTQWVTAGRKDVAWASGVLDCRAETGHAYLLADRVLDIVKGIGSDRLPFFLHVAFEEPHQAYFAPPPFADMVDPAEVFIPESRPERGRPEWQEQVEKECGMDRADEGEVRAMIARYYGRIAYADSQMQRLMTEMDKQGLLENTWIVVSSDHGDYLGEKNLCAKSESLYECLLHVPLIIRPPDGVACRRGLRMDGFVDLVDLFPTILTLAGIEVPDYAQGHDLIRWVEEGGDQPLRDCLFAQVGDYHGLLKTTWPSGMPVSGRHPSLLQGARTREYSFVNDPDYGDEAYDLRKDPAELSNLLILDQPEPEGVTELRRRVERWEEECDRLRDEIGVVPGYRGF